ncbi:hypothetical protein CAAN1_04S03378 [[Candida] anglica]|uniref:WD-like domain-containing protein n=1 Tax=[Candida] anglica TaxID=148631 RepID=A0ABP0EAP5_9ASCO
MRVLFILFTLLLQTVICESYADSLRNIVTSKTSPVDNSEGVVTFKSSSFGLADYGISGEDVEVHSFTSYNYLNLLSTLASTASEQGHHGDVVYLYYKFIFGGQPELTSTASGSVLVSSMALDLIVPSSDRNAALKTVELLGNSTSIDEIVTLYSSTLPGVFFTN